MARERRLTGRSPMRKTLAVPLLAVSLVMGAAAPAAAAPAKVIVLPGAMSAEPIAAGEGTTFYAGDLFNGTIFRGDIRRGTAEKFADAPAPGAMAAGLEVDVRHNLLFVAGGSNKAYVYNTRTKARVATYDLGDPATAFINDVTLT